MINKNQINYFQKAMEAESQGKVESAINFYEKAGDSCLEDACSLALQSGLLKKCIGLYKKRGMKRQTGFLKEVIENRSRTLQKYLARTAKYSKIDKDLLEPIFPKETPEKDELTETLYYVCNKN
ncbi:MAG TPA: hypothetical protein VJ912_04090 [Candidatus Nanoarchaeia archaeon]|nr:hypothetical protein [Candidatus Nanoarchaeia archaeon]